MVTHLDILFAQVTLSLRTLSPLLVLILWTGDLQQPVECYTFLPQVLTSIMFLIFLYLLKLFLACTCRFCAVSALQINRGSSICVFWSDVVEHFWWMMTVPMDNSSAPSTQELVQRLLKKVCLCSCFVYFRSCLLLFVFSLHSLVTLICISLSPIYRMVYIFIFDWQVLLVYLSCFLLFCFAFLLETCGGQDKIHPIV